MGEKIIPKFQCQSHHQLIIWADFLWGCNTILRHFLKGYIHPIPHFVSPQALKIETSSHLNRIESRKWEKYGGYGTVWSEGFLYKVALPELKISLIMYFVMYNSVVLSKILKSVVPLQQNFEKTDFYSIKLVILIIIDIGK